MTTGFFLQRMANFTTFILISENEEITRVDFFTRWKFIPNDISKFLEKFGGILPINEFSINIFVI